MLAAVGLIFALFFALLLWLSGHGRPDPKHEFMLDLYSRLSEEDKAHVTPFPAKRAREPRLGRAS